MRNRSIICFGETLWDVLPGERKPGGAPMNVAVHLQNFSFNPTVISKVGSDALGKELLLFLEGKGVNTALIQTDNQYPTGVVNVQIADNGDASYDIVFPSAWDFIDYPEKLVNKEDEKILIFGSLASRNENSRTTLLKLLGEVDVALFDVNFRAPHYSRKLIEQLLRKSQVVKLNEHEIQIIGEWISASGESFESLCIDVSNFYGIPHIILTMGGDGAMVHKDGLNYRHHGFKVKVKDTVGSGDSFLAAYIAHFLKGSSIEQCLEMACATGAFVASNEGAVPEYQLEDITQMISSGK